MTTKETLLRIRDLKQDKYQAMLDIHYLRPKIAELKERIEHLDQQINKNKVILNSLVTFPDFKKKMRIFVPLFVILFSLISLLDYSSVDIIRIVKLFSLYSVGGLGTYFLILHQEKQTFKGYTEDQLTDLIDEQTNELEMKRGDLVSDQRLKETLSCQKNSYSAQIVELSSGVPKLNIVRDIPKELSMRNDSTNTIETLNKMYCLKRPKHKTDISR